MVDILWFFDWGSLLRRLISSFYVLGVVTRQVGQRKRLCVIEVDYRDQFIQWSGEKSIVTRNHYLRLIADEPAFVGNLV